MFFASRRVLLRFAAVGMATLLAMTSSTIWASDFAWETSPLSTDWNSPANWDGPLGGVPDAVDDTALVSGIPTTGNDPTLTSHRTIGALTIANNGDVLTGDGAGNNYRLVVQSGVHSGAILIEDPGSSLTIYASEFLSDVQTDAMTINPGGDVFLRGPGARLEVKALDINVGGEISGAGTIWITSANSIINNGLIRAEPHGGSSELTILPSSAGEHFDMDGDGNGSIEATAETTLYVQTQIDDPFDGTLTIGRNAEFYMDGAWTLSAGSGGTIDFDGGTGTATLSGANLTSDSTINVNSGTAVFDARLFANAGSTLNIAANTTVEFGVQANLSNPNNIHNGNASTWIINGSVTVGEGSGDFDWDGEISASSTTIVNPDGRLNIDVDRVYQGLLEAYQGTIEMNSGSIDVQNSAGQWEMAGELNMHRVTGEQIAVLSGAEVRISGDVMVTGNGESRIAASTVFYETSSIDVGPGAEFTLGESGVPIAFVGGDWTGSGTVNLNADWNVIHAPTTVNMPDGVFDLDGDFLDRLSISAPITLNVRAIDDDDDNEIRDEIVIRSDAQLNVQFTNPGDFYRITTSLDLEALGGTDSTVHLAGAPVELAGTTTVTGNSISDALVAISGTMDIASGGSFELRGSSGAPDLILSEATFTGSGSLINSSGSALTMENGTVVGVELINHGYLEIGFSQGTALVDSFIQTASGQYEVEIDGLIPVDQYDQLSVENDVQLDGTLRILVNGNGGAYADPTVPGTFDEFALVVSGDAVAGQFSDVIYDADALTLSFAGGRMQRFHVGEGLFRILAYGDADVQLLNYQALPGDANGDGIVDGLDFIIWNASKFTSGNKWTTGDFTGDGITDGLDFIVWNAHKFTSVGFPTLVPEPTVSMLTLVALIGIVWCGTRGSKRC